jgi:hypothetical protein
MNLPHEEAKNKKLEAKAAVLFGNAMDIRAAKAAKVEIVPDDEAPADLPAVEAIALMDGLADAAGLPNYSTMKRQVEMLKRLARDLDQPSQPVAILKRAILGDINDILLAE